MIVASSVSRREWGIVVGGVLCVHAVFFALGVPLPHLDLFFYVHPAVELATTGRLAAPASVHHDLTYPLAFYGYPPGYSLFLAGWFTLFGVGAGAMLAYTLTVHAALMLVLYAVLRGQVGAPVPASVLATGSVLPFFNHGRPDLTALLCAALGLWACGKPSRPGWWGVTGALCGLGLLVSPGYGASALVAVFVWCAFQPDGFPVARRLLRIVVQGGAALAVFVGGWLGTVAQQGAWSFGLSQFQANAVTRGRDLNTMPNLMSGYALLYTLVPLGLLLLPWFVWAAARRGRSPEDAVARAGALAYLAGGGAWFLSSKAFFLVTHHLDFLGRPLAQAALTRASDRRLRLAGYGSLVLIVGIVAWHEKAALVPRGYWDVCRQVAALQVPPGETWAVDGVVYLPLVGSAPNVRAHLLSYEEMQTRWWRRSLPVTPARLLEALPESARTAPPEPDQVVATPFLAQKLDPLDPARFRRDSPESARPGSLDRDVYRRIAEEGR